MAKPEKKSNLAENRESFYFNNEMETKTGMLSICFFSNTIHMSEEYAKLLKYPTYAINQSFESWKTSIHPTDKSNLLNAIEQLRIKARHNYSIEAKIKSQDQQYITVKFTSKLYSYNNLKELDTLTFAVEGIHIPEHYLSAKDINPKFIQASTIFDAVDHYIYVSDLETHELLFVNKRLRKDFKLPNNLNGTKCYKLLQGKEAPCSFCTNKILLGKNNSETHTWEFKNSLQNKWFRCEDKIIKWIDGRKVRMEIAIDISSQKQYQQELNEKNKLYELAAKAGNVGLWNWEVGSKEVFYSSVWKRQIGYEPEELPNQFTVWEQNLHPEDKNRSLTALQQYLQKPEGSFSIKFRFKHKNGTYRWIKNESDCDIDDNGNVVRMYGAHTDITESTTKQLQTEQYVESLTHILDSMPFGVLIINKEKEIVNANKTALNLTQYSNEDILDKTCLKTICTSDCEHCRLIDLNESINKEERTVKRKDGSSFPVIKSVEQITINDEQLYLETFIDISKHKETQLALFETQAHLQTALSEADLILFTIDLNGLITFADGKTLEKIQDNPRNLVGQSVFDVFKPYKNILDDIKLAIRGNEVKAIYEVKDILINCLFRPIKDDQGVIKSVSAVAYNNTELIEQSLFIQSILNTSPNIVHIYNIEERNNKFANNSFEKNLGYAAHDLDHFKHHPLEKLMRPKDYMMFIEDIAPKYALLKDNEVLENKFCLKDKNEEWHWIRSKEVVFKRDINKNPLEFFAAYDDITDEVINETKLQESEKFHRQIFNTVTDGIIISDNDGVIIQVNPKISEMYGYSSDELIGASINLLFQAHNYSNIKAQLNANNKNSNQQFSSIKKEGETIQIQLHSTPVILDNNNFILNVIHDITELNKHVTELEIARKKAEDASMQKNLFLANMSHEIRTPMNGVIGFSSLLKDDNLSNEKKRKYLNVIDTNSKQLLNLIDDIIDVSKMEANELRISKAEFDIIELLHDIELTYNEVKLSKLKEHIDIIVNYPRTIPSRKVISDEKRIRQVLINLLNNALKFTEQGSIQVDFFFEKEYLKFAVRDTGIGIPEGKLQEIFDSFKQVEHKTGNYGGTGLGLSISKGIVNLLKGDINVSSQLNVGSTFSFTIPIDTNDNSTLKTVSKTRNLNPKLKDKTILVAEDEETVRFYIEEILGRTGANLIFAANGAKVVELYKNTPDVAAVLMDIRMPVLNGQHAMQQILKYNSKAIVIMQTAYAMPNEKELCFQLGCKDYLSKPINKSKLLKVLEKWVE